MSNKTENNNLNSFHIDISSAVKICCFIEKEQRKSIYSISDYDNSFSKHFIRAAHQFQAQIVFKIKMYFPWRV